MTDLPGAIIIGAQKCGTTTLHNTLIRHSLIRGALDPVTKQPVKEVDFFYSDKKWEKGINWYKSYFSNADGLAIESSPNYLAVTKSHIRISQLLPDIKIIVCLRNPVFRAYSQYNHYKQVLPKSVGWDWDHEKDFSENINEDLQRQIDPADYSGLVSKGIFINQINNLLTYFRKEQIYISIMEKWAYGFNIELKRILEFLDFEEENLTTKVYHKRQYTVENLDSQVGEKLNEFYKPYNQQLFDFLGYDIPEWKSYFKFPQPTIACSGLG